MVSIEVGQYQQQIPILQQIKTEPAELILLKNNNNNLTTTTNNSFNFSSNNHRFFLEPILTTTPSQLIDTSTPESLERDFHAWMKGELQSRTTTTLTQLEPVSMYLSPLKGEFNNSNNNLNTTTLIPLTDYCYSPPNYYNTTSLQPLLPLSNLNENERRFSSLPSLKVKLNNSKDNFISLQSAGQSPSSSTNSSSSEGGGCSPSQIQRRLNNEFNGEQLKSNNLNEIISNKSRPSIDSINNVQIDSNASRSSGVNQLGRTYSPGLPLSMSERQQIVDLHKSGWKICDISKCLCVTHSCVSKILQRYRTTGSVRPKDAKEGRQESPLVAAIRDYRIRLGIVRQSEIREQLIRDGLCRRENAPSRSSINHILRTKLNNIVDSHRQNIKSISK